MANMAKNVKKRKGFTLIELLAVIVILAVIALIATPMIMNAIGESKSSELDVNWFLWTPILKGYYTLTEVKTGVVTLYDALDAHEAILDVQAEEDAKNAELNNG